MAKAESRVEKKQAQYGSDVVVDLMKAHDIEYAAFNPGATFAVFMIRSSITAAITSRR